MFASEAKSIAARYWFLLSFLLSSNQMNRARQTCLLLTFPFGIFNSFPYKSTFDWIVGFTLELFANFIRIFAIEKREFHITRSTMRQRDVNFIWKYFCIIIEFEYEYECVRTFHCVHSHFMSSDWHTRTVKREFLKFMALKKRHRINPIESTSEATHTHKQNPSKPS